MKFEHGTDSEAFLPKQRFRFADLFAGIGGMRIGFDEIGGDCVFSSEWDIHSQKTYEANFGEKPLGDITKIHEDSIPSMDVLLAGFPCQPFSTFGKRAGFLHETQGTLFYDVLRIITRHRPKSFLLENVKGLVNHDQGRTFEVVLNSLSDVGYEVDWKILNSVDFGVPQTRERVFIVGFLSEAFDDKSVFNWPVGKKELVGIGSLLQTGVQGYEISKHLQSSYIFKKDDGRPQIVDRASDFPVKTLVASYHKIQRLSGTFVADGPTGLRLFTPHECKLVMGFPADFKVPVSRTQMYRQFGNSVAVPVVREIAKQIVTSIARNTLRSVEP